ncbi:MAG: FtsQ-type POTRA domain-containing protein [Syntrophobacteraceae bacterium]|nr:FtsQ-type POTRA domain-containing protein [Desulfobacteraceae bacterium]
MGKKKNKYRSGRKSRQGLVRSWLKGFLAFSSAVSGIILLSAGLAWCYHALLDAPWLRVEEVRITGLKHVERKEILNVLGVPKDTNVLTVRVSDMAARLDSLPWLRSSVVRLDLPRTIVVEVTEREPIAMVQAEEWYLMDREGKLFSRTTPEDNPGLLPVTGFSGVGLHEGSTLPVEPLEDLKAFLHALEKVKSWLPLSAVAECQWNSGAGVVFYTAQKAVSIRLGSEGFGQKLDRLQGIYTMLNERGMLDQVSHIDLDYPNRAFVEGRFQPSKGA